MHAFQFFVHQTAGIIADINSAPLNPCAGAFYSFANAEKFGNMIADKLNFTSVYDVNGKLHTILKGK